MNKDKNFSECNYRKFTLFGTDHLFAFFIITILTSSCQKNIDFSINTNDLRLVVNGEFTNDIAIHEISLYSSGSIITGQRQTVVSGASIYVTDNIDTFRFVENNNNPGFYQTEKKCQGIGGRTYILSISNIDLDRNGKNETFTSQVTMPVPVRIDSMVSKRASNRIIDNNAYFSIFYNGPDYIYYFMQVKNKVTHGSLSDRLGTGEINRFEKDYKFPKVKYQDSIIHCMAYQGATSTVVNEDTLTFIAYNLTQNEFEFLKIFDNNTINDPFQDNFYDQLKIPVNLPTNIEPANKAAGYFFVYSISRISKIFKD